MCVFAYIIMRIFVCAYAYIYIYICLYIYVCFCVIDYTYVHEGRSKAPKAHQERALAEPFCFSSTQ